MAAPKKSERFQTLRILYQNSYGRAELANDAQTGSRVIVRHFPATLFQAGVDPQQFVHSVKAGAGAKREGFQRVLALGLAAGEPWVVCTGSDAGTLKNAIDQATRDPAACVALFEPLASRLDQFHATGQVHGVISSDTLVFDREGALLLGETVTWHALFQWQPGPVRFPDGVVGELIPKANVAPETAKNGIVDARAEQWALTRCLEAALQSAYAAQGGIPDACRNALNAGLNENPFERYSSCAAMVGAVKNAVGSRSAGGPWAKRAALAAAPIAALIVAYVAGSWIGQKTADAALASHRQKKIDEFVSPLKASFPKVGSVERDALLLGADDRGATVLDGFIGRRESKHAAELRKQLDRIQDLSRLKLDLDFGVRPNFGPGNQRPIAIATPMIGPPKFGDAAGEISCALTLQAPSIGEPVAEYRLLLRTTDEQGKPVGPDQVFQWDGRQAEQQFRGTIAPPGGAWAPGSRLNFECFLAAEGTERSWQKFDGVSIATFDWQSETIKLSPDMVKAKQADGYAIAMTMELQEGDVFRVEASGKVQPATKANYDILAINESGNGPEGIEVKTENVKSYDIVHNKSPWGALLVRFGSSGEWRTTPAKPLLFEDQKNLGGQVFLSINSTTKQNGKALPANDSRWWQPNGAFDVVIQRGRLHTPPASVALAAARPALLNRLAVLCGVKSESDLPAPTNLTGPWESSDGTLIDIVDSGNTVRLLLTKSPNYQTLEFTFDRDQNDYAARKCLLGMTQDKQSRTYETDGQLIVSNADDLTLVTESLRFDNGELARRQPNGSQIRFSKVKPKPLVDPKKPKSSEAEGLLAIDFSGTWRSYDLSSTFLIRDDGKVLKVSMIQSDKFEAVAGEIEKTADSLKVTQWKVTRPAINFVPPMAYELKATAAMRDPTTLIVNMDGLQFNQQTGALEQKFDLAIKSTWIRQTALPNGFGAPQFPPRGFQFPPRSTVPSGSN